MKNFFILLFSIVSLVTYSQELDQNWSFLSINKVDGTEFIKTDSTDVFTLKNGSFTYSLKGKDNLKASGNYIHQNNLLIINYKEPKDTVRYFNIISSDNASLTLSENDVVYNLSSKEYAKIIIPVEEVKLIIEDNVVAINEVSNEIVPSQNFSFNSLWRGVLGMVSLIVIAFLFSANRKWIDWKTVGLGVAFQLIIAIGVLKVPFVQKAFELVGSLFIEILNFTRAGSEFLFSGLVGDMDSFGFIFAFQVLPTIIFFSALTSLLFYLGVIQFLVKALALLATPPIGFIPGSP